MNQFDKDLNRALDNAEAYILNPNPKFQKQAIDNGIKNDGVKKVVKFSILAFLGVVLGSLISGFSRRN